MIDIKKQDLVSVVIAVYKPNEIWFSKQLNSLKNQTYKNLEFIFCDDCPECPVDENFIRENLGCSDFKLVRNQKNMGSNLTFEKLTSLASGKYISYCDQDDIWDSNKIEQMMDVFNKNEYISLVYSDLRVIDGDDKIIADSFADIRKRVIYKTGKNLTKDLVITNFVTGCAMMIKTDIAQKAIPFQTEVVHDQWLAIFASMHGEFYKMENPLISYRQHGTNQTGILVGVKTKEDYLNLRIRQFLEKTRALKKRLSNCDDVQKFLSDYENWLLARERFFLKPNKKDKAIIKEHQNFGKHHVLFDTTLPFVPNFLFPLFLSTIQKLANKGKI